MANTLRLTEKWMHRGLWLVAFVFAGFLIGLGGTVVGDLPKVEKQLSLDDYMDANATLRCATPSRLPIAPGGMPRRRSSRPSSSAGWPRPTRPRRARPLTTGCRNGMPRNSETRTRNRCRAPGRWTLKDRERANGEVGLGHRRRAGPAPSAKPGGLPGAIGGRDGVAPTRPCFSPCRQLSEAGARPPAGRPRPPLSVNRWAGARNPTTRDGLAVRHAGPCSSAVTVTTSAVSSNVEASKRSRHVRRPAVEGPSKRRELVAADGLLARGPRRNSMLLGLLMHDLSAVRASNWAAAPAAGATSTPQIVQGRATTRSA